MDQSKEILDYIRKKHSEDKPEGLTAAEISSEYSMWNTDTVKILNELVHGGLLEKVGKKPIRYIPAKDSTGHSDPDNTAKPSVRSFENIIGFDGSLINPVRSAKAAVLYPPHGLHTLVLGESGVGKSMFAGEMWKFAKEHHAFPGSENIPFVTMNCAEYADNPQLLLSYLFGHIKGAFTGADSNRAGLVQEADNGILFLDEIHRLPETGQEMLFRLIDCGEYHRLGDSRPSYANIMLIAATTEDPEKVLLSTFQRRIPVSIYLPPLHKRPIEEKILLIKELYKIEARTISHDIHVTGEALSFLLSHKFKANIGDLKKIIQLSCASSYLPFVLNESDGDICIYRKDFELIPMDVSGSELSVADKIFLKDLLLNGITVSHTPASDGLIQDASGSGTDYCRNLYSRCRQFMDKGLSPDKTLQLIAEEYNTWQNQINKGLDDQQGSMDNILSMIPQNIADSAHFLIEKAEDYFGRKYPDSVYIALALHLDQAYQRTKSNNTAINPKLSTGCLKTVEEYRFIQNNYRPFSDRLGLELSEDEISFLGIFLSNRYNAKSKRIGMMIVANGDETATSIANFTCRLLEFGPIYSVNVNMYKDTVSVNEEICRNVQRLDMGLGVLIITSEDSCVISEKEIFEKTGCKCRIFDSLGTTFSLAAAKMISSEKYTLDEIVNNLDNLYWKKIFKKAKDQNLITSNQFCFENESKKKPIIIVSCTTGIGTAIAVRDLLIKQVPSVANTTIITMSILEDIKKYVELNDDVVCIFGNIDPGINGIPFINNSVLFNSRGIQRVNILLMQIISNSSDEVLILPEEDHLKYEMPALLSEKASSFAPNLPTEILLVEVDKIAHGIFKLFNIQDSVTYNLYICLCIHLITLFSRIKDGDPMDMPDFQDKELEAFYRPYAERILEILNGSAKLFGLTIPLSEAYYTIMGFSDAIIKH